VTKAAFGIFLATFAYAVVAQVLEGARDSEPAQSRAVTAALVLVAASLVVFVVYVTATMKLLQVSWVITAVANETRAAVAANYPAADGYLQTTPPRLSADPRVVRLSARDGRGYKGSLGVVLGIDRGPARQPGTPPRLCPGAGCPGGRIRPDGGRGVRRARPRPAGR
jgi:Predicted membrane protein (DUF2254)